MSILHGDDGEVDRVLSYLQNSDKNSCGRFGSTLYISVYTDLYRSIKIYMKLSIGLI